MVKKLRRKFVLTAMLSLLVILICIIGVINVVNYVQIQNGADERLSILAENGGFFPDMRKRLLEKSSDSESSDNKSDTTEPESPPDFTKEPPMNRDGFFGDKAA